MGKRSPSAFAFDLDGTLVRSASGRRFVEDPEDWVTTYTSVIPMLREIASRGYGIAIFSNQLPAKQSSKLRVLKARVGALLRLLKEEGVEPFVFFATSRDKNRKPGTGMWDFFIRVNGKVETAAFCGDAEGETSPHPSYRWSNVDALFARNIGIPFIRPVDMFPGNIQPPVCNKIAIVVGTADESLFPEGITMFPSEGEMLVVVGDFAQRRSRDNWKLRAEKEGRRFEIWWFVREESEEYSRKFEDPRDDGSILYRF